MIGAIINRNPSYKKRYLEGILKLKIQLAIEACKDIHVSLSDKDADDLFDKYWYAMNNIDIIGIINSGDRRSTERAWQLYKERGYDPYCSGISVPSEEIPEWYKELRRKSTKKNIERNKNDFNNISSSDY